MFKALFYKEWAKTKSAVCLLTIIFVCFVAYTFINMAQLFRLTGAVEAWSGMILKDAPVLPAMAEYLPLAAGLFLGISQYVPEMVSKRFKLTLHLPVKEGTIVSSMLWYGMLVLFLLFAVTLIVLFIGIRMYYPMEVLCAALLKCAPWFIAGFAGYLFSAWVCLEPVWRRRILNSVIGVFVLTAFYINARSGAYITFLPSLIVLVAVCFSFPFYAAVRFKEGAQ